MFVKNNAASEIDPFGLVGVDVLKKLVKDIKKAAEELEDGKCPKDPCKLPSSLNAICTCVTDAYARKNRVDMINCICQMDPDEECDKKALAALDGVL